jgi:hypothetical protein
MHLVAFAPYRGRLLRYGTTANEWSHLSLRRRFLRANYLRQDHFRVWLRILVLSINMQHKQFAMSIMAASNPVVALLKEAFVDAPLNFAGCTTVPWILKQCFHKHHDVRGDADV